MKRLTVNATLGIALAAAALAQASRSTAQDLPQLHGASVRAQIVNESGFFRYQYRLAVSASETLGIEEFTVDARTNAARSKLGVDGLPSEASTVLPQMRKRRDEAAANAVALVISKVPPDWSASIDPGFAVRWGSNLGSSRVRANGQLGNFEVSSHALPGVREVKLEPDLWDSLPNLDTTPNAAAIYDQVPASNQVTKTVGPVAPPAVFVPSAFAGEIESMLNEARVQGWISSDEEKTALLDKLASLKSSLDAGEFDDARERANEFLSEVGTNGCGVYSCGGSQALTSEGYALMRFNMEYLRERIPTSLSVSEIESDEAMDSLIEDEIFRSEGRVGDQEGLAATELSLLQDFAGPEKTAQFAWPNGVVVSFSITFDGRGSKFEVGGGGRTLQTVGLIYPLTVVPENIFVRASASVEAASVSLDGLSLDGQPIEQAVTASGANGLGIVRIKASRLDDGFVLRGNATFRWTATEPTGTDLTFQVRAVKATAGPQ